jgi:hypothetical protein
MERILSLPPAFERFKEMGGVLDFAVFEEAAGTEEEILSAVPHALYTTSTYDREKLCSLGSQRIPEQTFFGSWFDYKSGLLLQAGSVVTADGTKLENPLLVSLDGVHIKAGAFPTPSGPGEFAYAFADPPYGLYAKQSFCEVQAVFDDIRHFILPPGHASEISDWSSERLAEVSDYFEDGLEWWGVFLFSIYIPSLQRLTIIAGSTTD